MADTWDELIRLPVGSDVASVSYNASLDVVITDVGGVAGFYTLNRNSNNLALVQAIEEAPSLMITALGGETFLATRFEGGDTIVFRLI